MKSFLKISLLIVVAVSVVACSATPTRRSFNETWKDSVVSTKVKMKLTGDKLVKKRNIDVDAWRGVVTLTGRVTTMEEKERAEQLAWQANGVRGVDNYLKLVEDASIETEEVIADATETEVDLTNVRFEETVTPKKTKVKEVITVKKTQKVATKRPATHPLKSAESFKVQTKVTEPTVKGEYRVKSQVAKRGRYNKPESTQIIEEDLTSEESIAREAAEELRKLRGEE